MSIIAKVDAAIQKLLGKVGEAAAEKCGVIEAKRKFTLGFYCKPLSWAS